MARVANAELNVEISEENGLGEDSMMTFIRLHLASILQPFAARLDSLHRQLEELRAGVAEADARTSGRITDHTRSIREIRNELESLAKEVAEAKSEAAHASSLEPALIDAKADISALRDRFSTVQAQSFELQHEAKANGHHLHRLQAELVQQTNGQANKTEEAAQQLHAKLAALESAHAKTAKSAESAFRTSEETREELRKMSAEAERQLRRDEASFAQLRSAMSGLETSAKNTDQRLSEQTDELKVAKDNISTLQVRSDQVQKMQAVLETRQKDNTSGIGSLERRLGEADARFENLSRQVGKGEELAKLGSLVGFVHKLSERADQASVFLNNLDQASRRQLEQIQAGDVRAEKLQMGQDKLKDSLADLDARTVYRTQGLEALLKQQDQKQQQEMSRIEAEHAKSQQTVFGRLEAMGNSLAQTSDGVNRNAAGLDATSGHLENLRGDLSSTNESLTKLHSSMGLTQEYWKGLTKGLRHTHRSVAVDNELFNPKDTAPRSIFAGGRLAAYEDTQGKTLPTLGAKTAILQSSPPLPSQTSPPLPSARARPWQAESGA